MTRKKYENSYKKIISDKDFYKFWLEADKFDSEQDYIEYFTLRKNKGFIDFYKKYKINYPNDILRNIYKAAKLSFKEIVDLSGLAPSKIGYMFCIPQDTIKNWYSRGSNCNSYIRLMLIRYFKLLDLGYKIDIECLDKEKRKYDKAKDKNKKINIKEQNQDEDDFDFDRIDELLNSIHSKKKDLNKSKTQEKENNEIKELLDKTAYLDKLFRR